MSGQGRRRHLADPVGTKPDHLKLRALPQNIRQPGEIVEGTEQDPQLREVAKIIGQRGKAVTGQIERLQGVGEAKKRAREGFQPGRDRHPRGARERTGLKLFEGIH